MSAEFTVHCGVCSHTWVAAYLPLAIDDFVRVTKGAQCPRGCKGKVLCGSGESA